MDLKGYLESEYAQNSIFFIPFQLALCGSERTREKSSSIISERFIVKSLICLSKKE